MAGIGFALRHLQTKDTLTARSLAMTHAVIIVSGPWLLTVASIFLINLLSRAFVGQVAVDTFRLAIYYAYAIAFILSAPLLLVPIRLVADAFAADDFRPARGYLAVVFLIASVTSLAVSVTVFTLLTEMPLSTALAASACCVLLTLIFVAITFCGAIKEYAAISKVFAAGLFVSVTLVVLTSYMRADTAFLIAGFGGGLLVILCGLVARILATFPTDGAALTSRFKELLNGFRRFRLLAVGAAFSGLAIWIDKLVIWFSPFGERIANGLIHAPIYDAPVFLAYLTIVPALSIFLINVETGFVDRYRRFYATIHNGGTLKQISARSRELCEDTVARLFLLTIVQLAVGLALALIAPLIVAGLGLRFEQISVIRFALIGSAFHLAFIASTAILLFSDRQRAFAALQILFFILNGGLTALFASYGKDYLGYGYLLASIISGLAAFHLTAGGLAGLTRHVFIPAEQR